MSHHFKYVVELSSTKAFLTSPPLTHRHSVKKCCFGLNKVQHGLWTPNEGINQRNLKIWADLGRFGPIWADLADKKCFGRT